MTLTAKQARFVAEYLIDYNATQAAIRAGYSEKSAYKSGYENTKKPPIAEAIAKAMERRSDRTQIDADWLLTRLADEAEADLADILDEGGSVRPVSEWPKIWRQGLVAGIDVETRATGDGPEVTIRKVKLSDRIRRLDLIGKHVDVQAFRERVEHSGEVITRIESVIVDPQDSGSSGV